METLEGGLAREAPAHTSAVKLAVVGAGRMGGAVIEGALRAGVLDGRQVGIYHPDPQSRLRLSERYGVQPLDDAAVHRAERVLLAVKPQSFAAVAPLVAQRDGSFLSLMAGVTIATVSARVGSARVVRAMPNLGARVGESATALAWGPEAFEADRAFARSLFTAIGRTFDVPEAMFDAFTGLTGSGPAFAAVVAEALADGGVRVGFARTEARELARQVLLATARLLEDQHPADLKDEVASAGGTAIAGLRALERHALRFALVEAVEAATERARELSAVNGSGR
jgi:pyrroline-5-carboxylate reductase